MPASQEFDDFKGVLGQDLTKSSFITSYPPAWWCHSCHTLARHHKSGEGTPSFTVTYFLSHLQVQSCPCSRTSRFLWSLKPVFNTARSLSSKHTQPQASCHCSPNKDHAVLRSQAQEEPIPGSLRCRSRSKLQMTVAHTDGWSWLGYQ